jgi:hypothetical protein
MVTRKNVRILILLACGIALVLTSTGCKKEKEPGEPNGPIGGMPGANIPPDEGPGADIPPDEGPGADIPPDEGPDVQPGKVYVVEPLVGIDKVRFGMTVEEMKEILGEPKKSRGPLHEYRDAGFAIFAIGDAVKIIACGDRGRADSPLVENCKCRTDKGIGMGSSREDIIEAYGEPSSTDTLPNGAIMLSYEPLKSEFLLMQDNVIYMSFAVEGFIGGVGRPRTPSP